MVFITRNFALREMPPFRFIMKYAYWLDNMLYEIITDGGHFPAFAFAVVWCYDDAFIVKVGKNG